MIIYSLQLKGKGEVWRNVKQFDKLQTDQFRYEKWALDGLIPVQIAGILRASVFLMLDFMGTAPDISTSSSSGCVQQ